MAATTSRIVRPQRVRTSTILRHVVINFFMLLIILPLAWVLLLSIKSIPDAYTGDLWPKQFDFSHYGYVLSKGRVVASGTSAELAIRDEVREAYFG